MKTRITIPYYVVTTLYEDSLVTDTMQEWLDKNHAYYNYFYGAGMLVFDTGEDLLAFKLKYEIR